MKPSIGSGTTRQAALPNAPVMPPPGSDDPASAMAACRHKISSRGRAYVHGVITMLTTAHQVTGTHRNDQWPASMRPGTNCSTGPRARHHPSD